MEEKQEHSSSTITQEHEMFESSERDPPMSTGGSDDTHSMESESDADSSSRDILNYHVKGLWGQLERIPLNLKLLFVSFVSILGLVIFGVWLIIVSGNALTTYQIATRFQQLTIPLQDMITALGVERGATSSWATNPTPSAMYSVSSARTTSDTAWLALQPVVSVLQNENSLDELTRTYVNNMAKVMDQLKSFRGTVNSAPDFSTILTFFTDTISNMLTVQQRLCSLVSSSNSQQCVFHSYLLRMNENTGMSRATGVVLTNLGDSSPNSVRTAWKDSIHDEKLYYTLLLASADSGDKGTLNSVFSSPLLVHLESVRANYVTWLDGRSPKPGYNTSYYFDVVTERITLIVSQIIIPVENNLLHSNTSAFGGAVGLVVAVIVSCIGCFLLSCCVTFGFSKTITGPWQRMLDIQQKVMHMFVPQSMLTMMKIRNVSQLTYGYNISRKVTVLTTLIAREKNFNATTSTSATEQLEFFNNFLTTIGGVIRSNGGYIHKHLDVDGFVAVFTSNSDAIKSAIAIHEITGMVLNMQNNNFPTITLHSGLCHGEAVIGTIGESRRMDISVISQCTRLSKILANLNKRYHTRILTTKESLVGTKKKNVASSRILSIIKMYGKEFHVHEVLDTLKQELLQFREAFNAATNKFYQHKFEEARDMYDRICQAVPQDQVARQRLAECNKMLFFCSNQKIEMDHRMHTVYNVLSSPVFFEAFEQFTKKEQSHENIRLWNAIQHYKAAPKTQRYSITKALYKEFLDESSLSMVNTNDKHRARIREALEKSASERESTYSKVVGILTDDLLDELIADIEFNMLDTFKRFKGTTEAKEALIQREIVHENVRL